MKRPTKHQRKVLREAGLSIPVSRAEAKLAAQAVEGPAREGALRVVIQEQRKQIDELRTLVRYQRIEIARLRAGEDIP